MSELPSISIQLDTDGILHLKGELDSNNLSQLWHSDVVDGKLHVNAIEVSKLIRVDSSGLALLVYISINNGCKLVNINSQLKTLIELYDLQPVVM